MENYPGVRISNNNNKNSVEYIAIEINEVTCLGEEISGSFKFCSFMLSELPAFLQNLGNLCI